jgi:hypothetical protein
MLTNGLEVPIRPMQNLSGLSLFVSAQSNS